MDYFGELLRMLDVMQRWCFDIGQMDIPASVDHVLNGIYNTGIC